MPSLPHQGVCKSRKDAKYCITKEGPNTEPTQSMEGKLENASTTTEPPPAQHNVWPKSKMFAKVSADGNVSS